MITLISSLLKRATVTHDTPENLSTDYQHRNIQLRFACGTHVVPKSIPMIKDLCIAACLSLVIQPKYFSLLEVDTSEDFFMYFPPILDILAVQRW